MRSTFTIHALSTETGIDRRKLREWLRSTEPAETDDRRHKRYTIRQVIDAVRAQSGEVGSERSRLLRAQADKTELEADVLRGKYVLIDEVKTVLARYVGNCRQRLLAIPNRLGSAHGAEVAASVDGLLHEALYDLSRATNL